MEIQNLAMIRKLETRLKSFEFMKSTSGLNEMIKQQWNNIKIYCYSFYYLTSLKKKICKIDFL